MKPACDPSAGLNSLSPGDRYQLLGEQWDSKEVAIGMENFVIRGKAFFLQYLHLCGTNMRGRWQVRVGLAGWRKLLRADKSLLNCRL